MEVFGKSYRTEKKEILIFFEALKRYSLTKVFTYVTLRYRRSIFNRWEKRRLKKTELSATKSISKLSEKSKLTTTTTKINYFIENL